MAKKKKNTVIKTKDGTTYCEICQQNTDEEDICKCDECEEDGMCPDCLQEHKDEVHN